MLRYSKSQQKSLANPNRCQPNKPRSDLKKNNRNTKIPRKHKFEGSEPDLQGHVYRLGYIQADIFAKTTKEIGLFCGKTYNNGGDVKRSIDQLDAINIPVSSNLPTAAPGVAEVIEVLEVIKDLTARPPVIGVVPVAPRADVDIIPAPT